MAPFAAQNASHSSCAPRNPPNPPPPVVVLHHLDHTTYDLCYDSNDAAVDLGFSSSFERTATSAASPVPCLSPTVVPVGHLGCASNCTCPPRVSPRPGMSMSLPPARRHNPYRNSIVIPHTPPRTPPQTLSPDTLGPPSLAGSSVSASGASASAVNGASGSSTPAGGADVSSSEMDSHLAVLDSGSLGPPGASRRPSRRVRSIERTWHWVRSRSSVYGEAALINLEAMSEEQGAHSPPDHDPGPSRPLTMAFPTDITPSTPFAAPDSVRRQSTADLDPEERRRRRQGLTPESGLRPPPRPRPVSRSMTTPAASGLSGLSKMTPSPLSDTASVKSSSSAPVVPTIRTSPTHDRSIPNGQTTPRARPVGVYPGVSTPTSPPSSISSVRTPVQSISDIVRRHSTAVTRAEETAKDRARAELASHPDLLAERRARDAAARTAAVLAANSMSGDQQPTTPPPPPPPPPPAKHMHRREPSSRSSISYGSSDTDSVVRDYRLAQEAFDQLSASKPVPPTPPTPVAKTATATPPPSMTPNVQRSIFSPTPDHSPRTPRNRMRGSPDNESLTRQKSTTSLLRPKSSSPLPPDDDATGIAMYIRSSQLNRITSLPRPFPERPLQVSFADIGKPDGRPVVVFLGLGCVRYLIALYDDLARALGLRIICIDRWGLGKTDQVPQDRRGVLDWADVVRGVLDELGIERFQVVAHSAGAPYALACVLKMERRVHGKVHLLSPWVGGDVDGYKWLKWVPNGVIKSAIAAEWRLESYFLGKAPTIKQVGGSKKEAAMSQTSLNEGSRSRSSMSDRSGEPRLSEVTTRSSEVARPSDTFARVREHIPLENGEGFDAFANDMHDSLPAWPVPAVNSFTSSPAFAHALMQASHAESLSGTTADLLSVVLGRDAKPWGFSYTDIRAPCKIWYGAEDERVSEKSMRWMERAMDAELIVVQEEGHNLMSSRTVMYDVLDSVAEDI